MVNCLTFKVLVFIQNLNVAIDVDWYYTVYLVVEDISTHIIDFVIDDDIRTPEELTRAGRFLNLLKHVLDVHFGLSSRLTNNEEPSNGGATWRHHY